MALIHSRLRLAVLALALFGLLSSLALAAPAAAYCFTPADFSGAQDGIFLTAVPDSGTAYLRCGSRTLRAGDVLPAARLGELTLVSAGSAAESASISYLPVSDGRVGQSATLTIPLRAKKNEAPSANNSSMQTYKNIANSGTLSASDPEGGELTFTITKEPKYGTLELGEGGQFTYTPKKNKVGKDSFRFTATDPEGAVSSEATVSIEILKPQHKAVYSDMAGDPDQFAAMWLKEQEVFSGERIAGALCFNPDKTVTRGEFLAMTMRLLGIRGDEAALTSGFADEAAMPDWLRPYVVSAFRSGIVNGVKSDAGLVFRGEASLTKAEAAVIVQNILSLPTAGMDTDADELPAWAAPSILAVKSSGIFDCTNAAAPMTRREVAELLYQVWRVTQDDHSLGLLAWAAE